MSEQIRAVLRGHLPRLAITSITTLGAGQENVAYEVNGDLIVRLRKEADPDERAVLVSREVALLAAVAPISTLPVPEIAFADAEAGILAYRKLPGVPILGQVGQAVMEPERFAPALGAFVSGLHAAPVATMSQLVPHDDDALLAWRDDAAEDFRAIVAILPAGARRRIERFLEDAPPEEEHTAVFSHNDLGAEHILVDAAAGTITGIIDWSDAAIADPMYDIGRLHRDFGPAFIDELLRHYTGRCTAADRARMVFYARCTLIEDIAFGLRAGARLYTDTALANLDRVFA